MSIFGLKIVAVIMMFLDHIGEFVDGSPVVLRWIGRGAAPIFIFVTTNSWRKTSSQNKYLLRLYLASVIMGAVSVLLNIEQNFFRQLFSMCVLFRIIDLKRAKSKRFWGCFLFYIAWQLIAYLLIELPRTIDVATRRQLIGSILGSVCWVEGGWIYTLFGLLLYLSGNNKNRLATVCFGFASVLFLLMTTDIVNRLWGYINVFQWRYLGDLYFDSLIDRILWLIGIHPFVVGGNWLWQNYQWMVVISLPFLVSYNCDKGPSVKWFFYWFYPLHLIVLHFLC